MLLKYVITNYGFDLDSEESKNNAYFKIFRLNLFKNIRRANFETIKRKSE